jgi:hypothetical protein
MECRAMKVLGPCEIRWSMPGSHSPRQLFAPPERRHATSLLKFEVASEFLTIGFVAGHP